MRIVALLLAAVVTTGCAMVTVQTSTGSGTVSHDAEKGAIVIKKSTQDREQTP